MGHEDENITEARKNGNSGAHDPADPNESDLSEHIEDAASPLTSIIQNNSNVIAGNPRERQESSDRVGNKDTVEQEPFLRIEVEDTSESPPTMRHEDEETNGALQSQDPENGSNDGDVPQEQQRMTEIEQISTRPNVKLNGERCREPTFDDEKLSHEASAAVTTNEARKTVTE